MQNLQPPSAKVLVVDDNEANRMLAQHTLDDEGYEVILASNGAQGLEAFEKHAPDCVLLDVQMPGMDGIAVCERIRQLPRGAHTPVLFLTARRDVDTFDRAVLAGGDDFLTKPLHPTELVLRLKSALRVQRLTGELHDQYVVLKQQRDAMLRFQLYKERLTAFLVHDLKNPVNSLSLHTQVLQRQSDLPSTANASVQGIRTATRNLTRMISNLLDLSKADEGQLTPQLLECDLGALADQVRQDHVVEAESREVQLRTNASAVPLRVDRDLVERMLANLVENAIRYAPAGSTVQISVSNVEGGAELRVADAGQGIPAAQHDEVFAAFVRSAAPASSGGAASPTAAASGSRGLGLTFCKFVAEIHGGNIWIEDAQPGAIFCVRLPRGE